MPVSTRHALRLRSVWGALLVASSTVGLLGGCVVIDGSGSEDGGGTSSPVREDDNGGGVRDDGEDTSDTSEGDTAGYVTYSNPRYGFSTRIPASFRQEEAVANGDGARLRSRDGSASLTVYGTNNVMGQTPAAAYDELQAQMGDEGIEITYSHRAGGAITCSGVVSGEVVYVHRVVGSGSVNAVEWRYPTSRKGTYDAMVTESVTHLRPGDVTRAH